MRKLQHAKLKFSVFTAINGKCVLSELSTVCMSLIDHNLQLFVLLLLNLY